jgi:hypothetical protein
MSISNSVGISTKTTKISIGSHYLETATRIYGYPLAIKNIVFFILVFIESNATVLDYFVYGKNYTVKQCSGDALFLCDSG